MPNEESAREVVYREIGNGSPREGLGKKQLSEIGGEEAQDRVKWRLVIRTIDPT